MHIHVHLLLVVTLVLSSKVINLLVPKNPIILLRFIRLEIITTLHHHLPLHHGPHPGYMINQDDHLCHSINLIQHVHQKVAVDHHTITTINIQEKSELC